MHWGFCSLASEVAESHAAQICHPWCLNLLTGVRLAEQLAELSGRWHLSIQVPRGSPATPDTVDWGGTLCCDWQLHACACGDSLVSSQRTPCNA